MIVAATLTVIGLLLGIALVQSYALRLSGVLVVPLFAVYVLYDFLALPVFVLGTVAAYVGLSMLQQRTLLFGRQLLLASMAISMAAPLAVFGGLAAVGVPGITLSSFTFVGTILPGVAAYNYHQLDSDRRREDVLVSSGALVGLVALGASLVNLTLAPSLGRFTPPLLYGERADIAIARDATIGGEDALFVDASLGLILAVIVLGMIVSEGVYGRWGIRLNGIIALPLLALFALQSAAIVPLYVAGIAVVYSLLTLLHRTTLLYGRVLLSTGLVIAVVGAVPIAMFVPVTSALHVFFTAILIGVGAYNLHRMPPGHRLTSISLSAGAFAIFAIGLRLALSPGPDGLLVTQLPLQLTLLGAAIVAGGHTALRLERLRPADRDRRPQASSGHT
ncbi:poly-gamma-glutamate biosynthesis protein PgsC/CapC [Natrarchaeobaculum sulfurireducens]|uniref:Putative capsule polysaccharide biosynthesis protein, integral membrane protein n=1 Tax=Natrarchaeobaculum sulfurireducens TaxID=2044521 RepID=A0A346PMW1_9EURY|nr:poly-gamma-glutamate biosynthesis protein PgsC/CapC [Natrarchaeobaculum sulfurireducens]AXR80856.1 putative capsule polysaccharide biosynthesis protein, integral membrane protein [Natrarchaeobaculum sulfurireducens]